MLHRRGTKLWFYLFFIGLTPNFEAQATNQTFRLPLLIKFQLGSNTKTAFFLDRKIVADTCSLFRDSDVLN
jgi:hypothetical protein